MFLFVTVPYPFQPIQLTLVNACTIGIPSFILALEPNKDRIQGVFILNILKKSIPAGITTVISIILCIFAMSIFQLDVIEYQTLAVCLTAATEFMILFQVSMPFNKIRVALFILMLSGMTIGVLCFRNFMGYNFFDFALITTELALIMLGLVIIALVFFIALTLPMEKLFTRLNKKFEGRTFRPTE